MTPSDFPAKLPSLEMPTTPEARARVLNAAYDTSYAGAYFAMTGEWPAEIEWTYTIEPVAASLAGVR